MVGDCLIALLYHGRSSPQLDRNRTPGRAGLGIVRAGRLGNPCCLGDAGVLRGNRSGIGNGIGNGIGHGHDYGHRHGRGREIGIGIGIGNGHGYVLGRGYGG